jgi:hypothetical protein
MLPLAVNDLAALEAVVRVNADVVVTGTATDEVAPTVGGFYVVVALPAFDFIVAPPAYEVVVTVHTL